MTGATRFAASAASLRVGRARIALIACLAARHIAAAFVLRVSGEQAPRDLAWLGIEPDTIDFLVDHAARHADAVAALKRAGRLYACLETEDELRWKREQRVRRHQPPIYDRAMLKLTDAQLANAEAGGKRPYWRFRLSECEIGWRDRVAGPQAVKLTAVSDPVVVASDGTIAPALTAAIDDAHEGIGLLVRDLDQVEASAVHLDMLAALGGDPGGLTFAHLPPLPEAIATIPLRRLRQDGVEPAALATLLAAPAATAPRTAAELVAGFDLATAGRGVRSIGLERLRALNRVALAAQPYAVVADRLPPGANEAFWLAVRGGLDLLTDARQWWEVIGDDFLPPTLDTVKLQAWSLPPEPWDASTWERWTGGMADTTVLRLALTGEESGPDMARLLPLIGRDRAERRLLMFR